MRNLTLVAALFLTGPLWAESMTPAQMPEGTAAPQETGAEVKHKEIVVITEAEFVPISKYFESFDPNQLEPSAAGRLQPVLAHPN